MDDEKAAVLSSDVERRGLQSGGSSESASSTGPKRWIYRPINLGFFTLPYYASPQVQIVILAFVCFMCPGMFNAVNGMGGGGLLSQKVSTDANVGVYSTFAVVGFFAGTFTNKLGIKTALCFGGIGYSIYISSYLSFKHTSNYGYSVFAGVLLGVCAGLLWCGQGAIMMAYPPEKSKGTYIAWFWMIFNMGAVMGALIGLGLNINTKHKESVSDGTYIAFIIISVIGALLTLALVNAKKVVRTDGSKIILMKNPTWQSEIMGLVDTFKTDPYIVLLFPMFFASNWFYTYHFNDYNGSIFNVRTSMLNNVLYYLMQIVGAFIFGYALDREGVRRSVRAKALWVVLLVLTMAIWGGGFEFQKGYTRKLVTAGRDTKDDPTDDYQGMDWTEKKYIGAMFLYMFYGFYDAAWQTSVYWLMGALTNNGRKLAHFAGFYKGIQSAGAAIIWRLDGIGIPFVNIFASTWGLLAGSLLVALPVIYTKVRDSVPIEEDLKFSDESFEEVAATSERKDGRLSVDAASEERPKS